MPSYCRTAPGQGRRKVRGKEEKVKRSLQRRQQVGRGKRQKKYEKSRDKGQREKETAKKGDI